MSQIKPLVDVFRNKKGRAVRARPSQLKFPRAKVGVSIGSRDEVASRLRGARATGNKSGAKAIRQAIRPQKAAARAYAKSKGLL